MSLLLAEIIVLPILLPLFTGALLLLINERHHKLKFFINQTSTLLLFFLAVLLLGITDSAPAEQGLLVVLSANWAAPFGIVLVGDRLATLFLLVGALLANAALIFSYSRWARLGVHFHTLFQFLLMGINGALLTGDLFNLFVFFEVMLAASYGLLLHGYNITRIRAGMQYIVVNLLAAVFFLLGIALVYSATGTLNFADLAAKMPTLADEPRQLLHAGAAMLAVAFLTKSAIWPLGFWLPTTYSAASPPVAAMLVFLTKLGIYILLRLYYLLFGANSGASAGFAADFLLYAGLMTLAFGALGLLASQESSRIASYSAVISSGLLLTLLGLAEPSMLSAMLFYLISSTLAVTAFVLLTELIERIYTPADSVFALSMEFFAPEEEKQESAGVAIPAAMAFLGMSFVACALIIAGLPPLSGFIAKFNILHHLLQLPFSLSHWLLLILLMLAGLTAIIAFMRFGVRSFWTAQATTSPRLKLNEAGPVLLLLVLCISLAFFAEPLHNLLERITADLQHPQRYIEQVLSTLPTRKEAP
ncbi:monovalent cation/H+ antiporter subunit D [Rheinheimera sp. UJ63]|uniref:monovalent cation/H+ antiporter subunit D n=1 Tax=Rheinheimera sp. UJ63 TaxID=2910157 RepID=UPI001F188D6F|nr:monovalent cation/H+ antiporter subunit D [Rheinheimera sp. UJ63]MCF4009821.1 monovalent cation/H+ antiporter subunit D [Rheinheimera sp. UJ63]